MTHLGKVAARAQFVLRVLSKRNADGVAEAVHQQSSDSDSAFHPAILALPGLGNSEVQRVVPSSPGDRWNSAN